jgi:pyruvate dehydrogenase E2 component (dihydrolipoamide acetyltransferase)
MAEEVRLPEISENVDSGEVIQVLVAQGDRIEVDQSIVELETDKAAFEVPSTVAGTVSEVSVKAGDVVNVGQVLIRVETEGGKKPEGGAKEAEPGRQTTGQQKEAAQQKDAAGEEVEKPRSEGGKTGGEGKEAKGKQGAGAKKEEPTGEGPPEQEEEEFRPRGTVPEGRGEAEPRSPQEAEERTEAGEPPPASPSIRRLARELGVNIRRIQGSGPAGRILEEDVKSYTRRAMEQRGRVGDGAAVEAGGALELPDFSQWGEIEREPMSRVRRITARNLGVAWGAIPHVTQFDQADAEGVERFRRRYAEKVATAGGKLTVTAILIKVAAEALKVFPRVNASLDMGAEEIIYKRYVHIGVAVDTDRGLLVPVVRDADRKGITELAVELGDLAERARNKKIKPEEMEGASFTVSNLGGIGGTGFTPIVYHPQVAILGVARARTEVVLQGGAPRERTLLPLSLSYDHRLVDGADGARFLRWVVEALEDPLRMLLEGEG